MDESIRIEVIKGGYGVYVRDPKISEANSNPKKPWKDPWVEYHFDEIEEVFSFVKEVLPMIKPVDTASEFDEAFKRATADETE